MSLAEMFLSLFEFYNGEKRVGICDLNSKAAAVSDFTAPTKAYRDDDSTGGSPRNHRLRFESSPPKPSPAHPP